MSLGQKCYLFVALCVSLLPLLFTSLEESLFIPRFDSSSFIDSGMCPAAEGDEDSGVDPVQCSSTTGVQGASALWEKGGRLESLSVGQGVRDGIKGTGENNHFLQTHGDTALISDLLCTAGQAGSKVIFCEG